MDAKKIEEYTFLEQVFADTTVNVEHVKAILKKRQLRNFKNALAAGVSGKTLNNLIMGDKLEMSLWSYVTGEKHTLLGLLAEANNFAKSSPLLAPVLSKVAFVSARRLIQTQGWYELIVRFDEAERNCASYLALASCN